jgi:hypothetical protein
MVREEVARGTTKGVQSYQGCGEVEMMTVLAHKTNTHLSLSDTGPVRRAAFFWVCCPLLNYGLSSSVLDTFMEVLRWR